MSEPITVAVLMPAYNPDPKEIRDSLGSLHDQGIAFRLIVVDDGSKTPVEPLLPQTDYPLTCLRLEQNAGIVSALNAGLAHILDDPDIAYIARLDVADMMLPGRLARQVEYLHERPRMGMCGTDTICQFEDGTHSFDDRPGDDPKELRGLLKFTNPITHSSVMIKRHVIEELGPYRHGFVAAEDYEMWRRILLRYDVGNVPELLTVYIRQPGGISLSKPGRQLRGRLAVQWAYLSPLDFGDVKGFARTMVLLVLPNPLLNQIKIAVRGHD
jgi:glycosyltransferase involved in cell wall biosynthesis